MLGDEVSANLNVRVPWVSGNVGTKILLPKSQMQRIEATELGYERALQRSSRTSAIYYDCSSKIGWLIPELSLILHLVYAVLLEKFPKLEALRRIPYAKPDADGSEAALAAIKYCESVVLWKKLGEDKKEYQFKDLVDFYLSLFDNRKESMRLRIEHNELRADLGLRGWDFVDLRDSTAFYRCRLIRPPLLSGRPQWWDLTHDPNLLTIFGTEATQIIVPDRSLTGPCSLWAEVPENHDLFVGSVRCIDHMCRPREARLPRRLLSDGLAWHQPEHSNPFDVCTGQMCNPVQKLRDIGSWRPWHGLRNPAGVEQDGAVIFGRPKDVESHIKHLRRPCAQLPIQHLAPNDRVYLAMKPSWHSYMLTLFGRLGDISKASGTRLVLFGFVLNLCVVTAAWMFW